MLTSKHACVGDACASNYLHLSPLTPRDFLNSACALSHGSHARPEAPAQEDDSMITVGGMVPVAVATTAGALVLTSALTAPHAVLVELTRFKGRVRVATG